MTDSILTKLSSNKHAIGILIVICMFVIIMFKKKKKPTQKEVESDDDEEYIDELVNELNESLNGNDTRRNNETVN